MGDHASTAAAPATEATASEAKPASKKRAGSAGSKVAKREPKEVADEYLSVALKDFDCSSLRLPDFTYPESFPRKVGEDAVTLFGDPFARDPTTTPHMLLAGLERDRPLVLSGELLSKVVENMEHCTSALFAVSGQGKTRLACEALSLQYGMLLSAVEGSGVTLPNPSSLDVGHAVTEMVEEVPKVPEPYQRQSIVTKIVTRLLLSRVLVLEHLLTATQGKLTPYQWLLAQMYPRLLVKRDVFDELRRSIKLQCDESMLLDDFLASMHRIYEQIKQQPLLCFLDEAQLLNPLCRGMFSTSVDAESQRSLLSAVAKALTTCAQTTSARFSYSTLMGTGFSIVQIFAPVLHRMGKPVGRDFLFSEFAWPDSATKALDFIRRLADLSDLDEDVVNHVGGWLVGRARWSATFAAIWLQGARHFDAGEPIDQDAMYFRFFSNPATGKTLVLHHALGWFVESMTAPLMGGRPPFQTPGSAVARLGKELLDNRAGLIRNRAHLRKQLVDAVMHYSCKGGGSYLVPPEPLMASGADAAYDTISLVELGICCLKRVASKRSFDPQFHPVEAVLATRVILAEPLIVEAMMRATCWAGLVSGVMASASNATNSSGLDIAFERCCVPVVDSIFSGKTSISELSCVKAVESEIPDCLNGKWARGRSMFGVVVQQCNNDDLVLWAQAVRAARFDGQCVPLAFPSEQFGADVLLAARSGPSMRMAFVQLKLRQGMPPRAVTAALLSVDPELMLHQNRGKADPEPLKAFAAVYRAVFGVEAGEPRDPAFRVLVDCGSASSRKRKYESRSGIVQASLKRGTQSAVTARDLVVHLLPDDVNLALSDALGEPACSQLLTALRA